MKRRLIPFILAIVMLFSLAAPALAAQVPPSAQSVTVDGKSVDAQVYNIGGLNYFKLRDIAYFLKGTDARFSVDYDAEKGSAVIVTGEDYTGEAPLGRKDGGVDYKESSHKVIIDGVECTPSAYYIDGYNYFMLRDLGQLLGFGVSYDQKTNTAQIDSDFDRLSFANADVFKLTPKLDGKDINVTMYEDVFLANPNRVVDQYVSIYVPDNATKDSPIIFLVNNGGWQSDSYSGRNQVKSYGTEMQRDFRSGETREVTVGDYKSDSDSDNIGRALADGYVIVSSGARSRNNGQTNGEYLGHSPATMTDTKAVIRYLRYNKALLPAGDTEKIVITGTSGGGALSTVIAASGNSPDYFESLYEVGAAGIQKVGNNYVSTIGDDVFGVIAYCPITDFRGADMAYEWTYNETRQRLYAEGNMSYKGADQATVLANSTRLKDAYTSYLASLNLKTEDGAPLTTANLKQAITALMEKEIAEAIKEVGVEQMRRDIAESSYGDSSWLTINDDGTFKYDYDEHLYFVARNTALKISCAFSNVGTPYGEMMNEDNLFGSAKQEYSPFEFLSWELDAKAGNGVGRDDTGLSWDQYMLTDAGKALSKQIRMTSALDYLVDKTDGDTAPNWYVRHGMKDRDTSFAVEASLYYAMLGDSAIYNLDFEFAWLKPHSGNYDVREAYAWLESVLK